MTSRYDKETGPQNQKNANKQKKLNSRRNDITKAKEVVR